MIRKCTNADSDRIYDIVNTAATAYNGVIADDCYQQPYMPREELEREMQRVYFYGYEADGEIVGVMGIEPIKDVTLIRHAYVLPDYQDKGIGRKLLEHLKIMTTTPQLMVGTWEAAEWAIRFYRNNGFELLPEKDKLLADYWDIPQRQIETSIVMGVNINND